MFRKYLRYNYEERIGGGRRGLKEKQFLIVYFMWSTLPQRESIKHDRLLVFIVVEATWKCIWVYLIKSILRQLRNWLLLSSSDLESLLGAKLRSRCVQVFWLWHPRAWKPHHYEHFARVMKVSLRLNVYYWFRQFKFIITVQEEKR